MEQGAMTTYECAQYYSFWPSLIFFIGSAPLFYLIAKHNNFGIKEMALVIFGKRKYDRNLIIDIGIAILLLVPLTIWTLLIQSCNT